MELKVIFSHQNNNMSFKVIFLDIAILFFMVYNKMAYLLSSETTLGSSDRILRIVTNEISIVLILVS